MFEELEEMGVRVREADKYEKWFVCFDFEAYQRDFDEKVDAGEENSLEVEECRLVYPVMWTGWKHVMRWVRILESWYLNLLTFC